MTTIYLSSTYEDLKEYREVVYKALRKSAYDVIAMEDYVAADQRPVDKCLADVRSVDIYVGIFAFRYGYIPPETHGNPDKLSVTELEFRQAEKLDKPCLTFVVNESTPWRADFMDSQKAEDKGARVNAFRQSLLTEKMASSFSSPHELAALVLAAITNEDKVKAKTAKVDNPVRELAPEITWDIKKDGSPYPGLMHFTSKHASVFFGRETEVREILDRMRQPEGRFLIISGGSGTGKSSLVDAGVLPRLEESGLPGIGSCVCKRMVPNQGSHPFDALMRVLHSDAERAGVESYEAGQRLLSEPGTFSTLLKSIISKGMSAEGLVLFLDQMEELFTAQTIDRSEAFLSGLYGAVNEANFRVIATIRSDFLHYCHDHEDLLKVLRGDGHYPLGRVESYTMKDIIVKPARCAGLTIPDRLVRRLGQDTGSEPGSLPLLAFAMERLFQDRSGNSLSEKVYEALGGIAGAIGAHVSKVEEDVTKQLGADATSWFPKIFQSLIVVNIDGQGTRRRALKQTFAADLQPAIDFLSKERLLTTEGVGEESTVSVAHEKLFETWPALTRWVAENRDDLFVLRQAEIEAKEWMKHEYDLKYLWHSDRLTRLRDIVQRVEANSVDPAVREYVTPQDRLIERLHRDALSHQERLTIGQYLAAFDDPRRGVGLTAQGLPDIEWVEIPGGSVKLEEVKGPFRVKSFRIAKYPVTNIQFQAFIDAYDGYGNSTWWDGIAPSPAPSRSTWLEHNGPRTDVSWYEAIAFCRWLSARPGKSIRLPTEWEWQQAATGGDPKNIYPWGPEWDAIQANSDASELRRTTAVGMYPNGATKQGALDMAGNVWEWCVNKYEKPDSRSASDINQLDEGRVVRGGSWFDGPEYLRSSFRNRFGAVNRFSNVGFRLAQDLD